MKIQKQLLMVLFLLLAAAALTQSVGCGQPKCGDASAKREYESRWQIEETDLPDEGKSEREEEVKAAKDQWVEDQKESQKKLGWEFVGTDKVDGKEVLVFTEAKTSTQQALQQESSPGGADDSAKGDDKDKQDTTQTQTPRRLIETPNYAAYISGKGIPKTVTSLEKWREFSKDSTVMVCSVPENIKTLNEFGRIIYK